MMLQMDFDKLNPSELKEHLDFITANYQEALNNKTKSGSHQPLADYTSRKPYLLYLHLWSAKMRFSRKTSFIKQQRRSWTMTLMMRTSMRQKNKPCTTVNFLHQKYEKMKKQVGYEIK